MAVPPTAYRLLRSFPGPDRVQPIGFVGPVPFKPLEELQRADFLAGRCNKALGPVEMAVSADPNAPAFAAGWLGEAYHVVPQRTRLDVERPGFRKSAARN